MVATVLQLLTRMNVGGPARHALAVAGGLTGFDVRIAAGTAQPEEGELADPDLPVTSVPLRRAVSPFGDVAALLAVRGLLARMRPAIVHTHMAKAGAVGRLAASTVRPRPRTVHTFHGHVLSGYFSRPVEAAFVRAERVLARRTDVLVAVSEEIRDELLELGIGTPEQHRVIPFGLELSSYLRVEGRDGRLRTELQIPPDAPLIGSIGRLVPIKDHPTLLDAVALLPGVHLVLVGDGESRPGIEDRARRLGIAERVHITGWRSDVPTVLADLDVVVLTSRNEGTPAALIEAAAAARPVVATDVGGVRTVVEDGVTGLLVAPGDPSAVARALDALIRSPCLRAGLGEAARTRARELFTAGRMLRSIEHLYAELLE